MDIEFVKPVAVKAGEVRSSGSSRRLSVSRGRRFLWREGRGVFVEGWRGWCVWKEGVWREGGEGVCRGRVWNINVER